MIATGTLALWGAFLASATASDSPTPAGQPDNAASRRLLIVSSSIDCQSGRSDPRLEKRMRGQPEQLAAALQNAAGDLDAEIVPPNPSKRDLLDRLSRNRKPLWLVYIGHAHVKDGRSAICLPGPVSLAIDDLTAALPPGPTASLWFGACQTASVDVARSGTSIFSASPDDIGSDLRAVVVANAIIEAARDPEGASLPTDANCDGLITDQEVFEAVRQRLPPYGPAPVIPKLRRQSWAEVPLYEARRLRPGCRGRRGVETRPGLGDVIAEDQRYRAGRAPPEDALPPVLFVETPDAAATSVERPEHFVVRLRSEEARALADALLLPRVWRVATEAGALVIRDVRRPDQAAPLFRGPEPAGASSWAPSVAGQILLVPPTSDTNQHDEPRLRYVRPLTARDRASLKDGGYWACPCDQSFGQCYCLPAPVPAKEKQ